MQRFALARVLTPVLALGMGVFGLLPAVAQEVIPDKRFVVTRDIDFAGSDLQSLFDTSLNACQRACVNLDGCVAFTFNSRNNSCFPKSGVTDETPYDGAISARLQRTDPAALARAQENFSGLTFLSPSDVAQARNEAEALGMRHSGGQYSVESLLHIVALVQNDSQV